MMVSDILKIVASLLKRDDITEYLSGNNEALSQEQVSKILACYNLVISELSEEFLPVKRKKTMSSSNGVYRFSDFSDNPLEILGCYVNGKAVEYNQNQVAILCEEPSIEVVYSFYPEKATSFEAECPYAMTKISERIIAYGVAREILMIDGLYDEAVIYDGKFTNSLTAVLFPKKTGKMKGRCWGL